MLRRSTTGAGTPGTLRAAAVEGRGGVEGGRGVMEVAGMPGTGGAQSPPVAVAADPGAAGTDRISLDVAALWMAAAGTTGLAIDAVAGKAGFDTGG